MSRTKAIIIIIGALKAAAPKFEFEQINLVVGIR